MNTSVDFEDEIEVEPQRRRFTVDEFQRMGEAGIFAPDERLELIDGEVIQMTPVGPRHIWSVIHLNKLFTALAGDDLYVSPQLPVQVDTAQPNPDFAILRLPPGKRPGMTVPQPEECVLVVEVSDSTVSFDRKVKSRVYATTNIPEYWVLDLPRNRVVVHRVPTVGKYSEVNEYPLGTSFRSPALGGREFRVDDLLIQGDV